MIFHADSWYNVTKTDIKNLESIDKIFLCKLFQVSKSIPEEALYLELGIERIREIIKRRRICYFQGIISRKKKGMLYRFIKLQWFKPCPGDWTEAVKTDMADLGLDTHFSTYESLSNKRFKNMVKKRMKEYSFTQLLNEKQNHRKMKNLFYTDLTMQDYLMNKEITQTQKINILKWRTQMAPFKWNFKQSFDNLLCEKCFLHQDSQEESFLCKELFKDNAPKSKYEDTYNGDIAKEAVEDILKIMNERPKEIKDF